MAGVCKRRFRSNLFIVTASLVLLFIIILHQEPHASREPIGPRRRTFAYEVLQIRSHFNSLTKLFDPATMYRRIRHNSSSLTNLLEPVVSLTHVNRSKRVTPYLHTKPGTVENTLTVKYHHGSGKDLMSNISLQDLEHIKDDTIYFKSTEFDRWSSSHVGNNGTRGFTVPQYSVDSGSFCDDDPDLVILSPVPPDSLFGREMVRHTWASSIYPYGKGQDRGITLRIKLIFLIGTKSLNENQISGLKTEAALYKDIVAADFVDSYRKLAIKMMTGLHWVSSFCPRVKFVLKCDLDTFVNLPLLTRLLIEVSRKVPRFILGFKNVRSPPPVLRYGKWKVSMDEYPFEFFPRYLSGHTYAISGNLVSEIVSTAQYLPVLPIEDAFITGVVAKILRAPRLHLKAFGNVHKNNDLRVRCRAIVHNRDVSTTRTSLERMLILWKLVLLNRCPRLNFNDDVKYET